MNAYLTHILAALLVLDGVATIYGLRKGLVEANPIMRALMDLIGAVPTAVLTRAAAIAAIYTWPIPVLWAQFFVLVYAAVVANGLYQLHKAKKGP